MLYMLIQVKHSVFRLWCARDIVLVFYCKETRLDTFSSRHNCHADYSIRIFNSYIIYESWMENI